MKIRDIQVDGFGVWKGLTIEPLSDDITVFYGQNEAGKTTLMQFVRSMMFGFDAERREKYTPPVYGGLAGGSLDVVGPSGNYEIQRHIDPNRLTDAMGDLAVTDTNDGNVHGSAQLGQILCDIDESIFNNVFAIGLREIQELNALNSTDASELLYKLTSGLDRVSLVDVMRDQKSQRDSIWSTDPEKLSRLHGLAERRRKLLREIDELQTRSKRWTRIAAQSNDVSNELDDLVRKLDELNQESRLLEISIQISDRWQKRRILIDQIQAFGKLPDPRDVSIESLDRLNEQATTQRERIGQIKAQRRKIKQEAMDLPINRRLWAQKARIEALTEHSPWVESLQRQSDRLNHEVQTLENSLLGEVDGLGSQLKIKTKDVKDLSRRSLSTLKSAAKRLLEQQDRLNRLKDEVEKSEFDLGQHQDRLGNTVSDGSVPGSLEETTGYVNRLRRRIELEEKIEKLNATRHGLERDIDEVVAEQVLPVGKLSAIGLVFIAGFVSLGMSVLDTAKLAPWSSGAVGPMLMILGVIAGAIGFFMKYHWETLAKEELEDFRHQIDVVRQQLKRSKAEREELERQLPESIGQWEIELKDAEARLAHLEGLVPLENRVHSARSSVEDIRRRVSTQKRDVELADSEWRTLLRSANLPEDLEPLQLKEITQRTGRITDHNFRLEQFKHELGERNKELNTLQLRIDTLLHDCGLEIETTDILQQLNQLQSMMHEQRNLVHNRKELATKYRALRVKLSKAKRELDKQLGRKQHLLSNVGADTEAEFRQFELKHGQRKELVKQRTSLTEQIAAALGKNFTESDLDENLDAYGHAGLERQWELTLTKIEESKESQSRLQQQRGEFLQEVKMLGEDSRLDEARLELNSIDAEIAGCKRKWQILGTSSQMLEAIREKFESKRQPETLREASTYLERLTEGKYVRIWTRMVGEELLCDSKNDETITVDKLSRGTREAVYLSLRLALIGAYARRGAVLPIVLDDVLVNFDSQRARAAASLLCDFSRNGYQLLMFTCHEHMAELFHSLEAEVKVLPQHKDVVELNATPSDYRQGVTSVVAPEPQMVSKPEPANVVAPHIEYVPAAPVVLKTDEYDPELEYELSAVVDDQRVEHRLRHDLVYISPHYDLPIDLSGNEDIWRESNTSV